jgi:hypothetical protein
MMMVFVSRVLAAAQDALRQPASLPMTSTRPTDLNKCCRRAGRSARAMVCTSLGSITSATSGVPTTTPMRLSF